MELYTVVRTACDGWLKTSLVHKIDSTMDILGKAAADLKMILGFYLEIS